MDWKDGLTAAVVVGLGYWGIKSITKGDEDIPDAVCIHCGSIEIGGGGGVCIDCGRHPFNYGRAITAKEDDGYSDNSNTVFDAEDKKDPYEEYMELGEERIERTSDAWDEIAERFFEENGWTKSHMAYDTDRETNTLWVETEEGWEDTDIPAKKGEWLLTDMWDEAEWMGYQEWCKYEGKGEWDNDCSDKPYEHSTAHDDWAIVKDLTNLHDWTSSWDYPMFDYCGNCGQYYSPETGIVTDEEYQDLIHGANAESFSAEGGNREEQKWITTGVDFQWGNDEPVQPPSGFLVLLKCSGCGYEDTVPTSYNAIGCPDCEATMTGFEAGLLPSFRTNLDAESFSAENRCSVCGDLAVHLLKKGEIVLCDKHYQQQFGKYSAETFESPVSCKICGKTFDSFRGLNGHMNAHIPSHRKRAESFAAENTSVKKFPTLYKKDSANRIRIWDISVEKDSTGDYIIQTSSGLEGGKIKRDAGVKITAGKVTRTPKEQALAQANSKWVHKLDTGYYDTKLDASGSKRVTPMLAKPFDKHGHKIQYPAVAQRKFDGVRCLARNVPDSGFSHDVSLVSRTNREWLDLDHIRQQVAALKIPDNIILDGEIYAHHLTFNRLNGLTKKQKLTEVDKKDLASTNLRVYDCIDIDNPHWKYINRWRYLKKILTANPQSNLILTKNYRIDKPEDIGALHDRFVEEKYEGLIMRNINSPYEQKRSFHLQKVKSFVDEEYTIVGFKEGVGKNEGTPVWICETEQGFTFGAAPKGTKAEREEMWRDREEYVGKELTVKHFPPADKETGIPRLPIGKGVRSEADLPPKEAEFFDSQEENDADKMVGLSKKRTWMSAARTIMAATTLALGYMIYRNQMEGKR